MYIKVYKSYYKGMVMNGYQKTTWGRGDIIILSVSLVKD